MLLLRTQLKTHISDRRFLVTRVLRRQFDRPEKLLLKYGGAHRLRSLDALHLGIALDLQQRSHIDTLVTADMMLDELAGQEGLPVKNPLVP